MEGMNVFYGYSHESIHEFLDDLASYFASKDIAADRWIRILSAQIRGPARSQYNIAIGADGDITGALQGVDQAPAQYNVHREWLIRNFHTEEVQQRIKDQLLNLRQHTNESPRDFLHQDIAPDRSLQHGRCHPGSNGGNSADEWHAPRHRQPCANPRGFRGR